MATTSSSRSRASWATSLQKKAAAERWCRAVTNEGRQRNRAYQLCFGAEEMRDVFDAVASTTLELH
jgi:hypothetical protein